MSADPDVRFVTIDGYPIDVVRMERHEFESQVTDNPVEDGADVTDHVHLGPIGITLECLVSDTPIGTIAEDPTRRLEVIELDEDLIEIEGESNEPVVPLPSDACYQRLKRIRAARQPIALETSLERFPSMIMTNLSIPRESKTSGGLTFEAKFREIVIVEVRRTVVQAEPIGTGKEDFGLSLDKVINGRHVLWRKGKPPGTSPATVPPGEIVGQEAVYTKNDHIFHEDQTTQLTKPELDAFVKDLNRDSALQTRRGIAKAEELVGGKEADRAARGLAYLNARDAHPGQFIDRATFGL